MTRNSKSALLEESVGLLVQHFGIERVRAALNRVSNGESSEEQPRRLFRKPNHESYPSVKTALEQLRHQDEEKHRLLTEFYARLKERKVLPESQDVRHFAQLIGLKQIGGKSHKDMVPKLMRFLLEQPRERILVDLKRAEGVSEQQRQQGFSVLTDKLLGEE